MKHSICNKTKKYSLYILAIIVIYLIGYIIFLNYDNELIIPSPNEVIITTFKMLVNSKTYSIIFNTISRLIISLLISIIIGIILGLLAGFNKYIKYFLKPFISILRTTPLAALIMVMLLIFGLTKSTYIIVFLMITPIVYEAIKEGVLSLDKELMDVWKMDSKVNLIVIFRVIIPLIIPFLKTAINQSIGLGFKVLVMAEFITLTKNSIGLSIQSATQSLDYKYVFAWCIIVIILVYLIELIPYIYNLIKLNSVKLVKKTN